MKLLTALRTKPLREAQELYEKYLKLPFNMKSYQHDDWEMIEKHNKCVFVRSRGGSKTLDFTNWLVFRVLRTDEHWCWLACKGGQLRQALIYIRENPFVKKVRRETAANFEVTLITGKMIHFAIISTSVLGMRVDGIVFDEFNDLKPNQEREVMPQMRPMMTASTIHKTVYLGTLWIKALLNDYAETYPTKIRAWDTLEWLVEAGMIQEEIDEGITPEWEIDMSYRCIPTAPSGTLFPHIEDDAISYMRENVKYGIDFGSRDMCVGVIIKDNTCYVVEEYDFQLELSPSAFDFLKGRDIECEGGGYNDSEKFGEKSKMMIQRVFAKKQSVTNKWKATRQKVARGFKKIVVDRKACPNTYADIKKATFGDDGLYFKHPTKSPCHYLDAFLHAIKINQSIVDVPETNTYRNRRTKYVR